MRSFSRLVEVARGGERLAFDELLHEHALRAELRVGPRDDDEGMAVEGVVEALLVGGLVDVVHLRGDAVAQVFDHRRRVEAAGLDGHQVEDGAEVGEVGADRFADAGVLHLDGDGRAIV